MVNRLFCTSIKLLYRTLRGVPCNVTQHSTAAKRTEVISRELICTLIGLREGMVFITEQPKLKHVWTVRLLGSGQWTAHCILRPALLPVRCLTPVPGDISGVK